MNLEVSLAEWVAAVISVGYDSATVAAAMVRGAARIAVVKGASREQFLAGDGAAFDAVGEIGGEG